jgi:hypothetical protein
MTSVEFGTKDEADAVREEYEEHLCPDDDRRLKTVAFASDTPDRVLEDASIRAAATRQEREGPGQLELTDHERDRIDFSKANASVPHARAVKGIMRDAGVDDWTAHYDPTLTVDEHRDLAERASRDDQGQRLDEETSPEEQLAEVEGAHSEQCNHAEGHCRHGDPDACEFLTDHCGLSDDQVEKILDDQEADPSKGELPGGVYGALEKLWDGFRADINQAKKVAAGINEIRQQYGQDPLEFDELGGRTITKQDVEA